MAIYSDVDFAKDKDLKFEPQIKKPGPASQDLHIDQLLEYDVPDDIHTLEGYKKYLEEMEIFEADKKWNKFRVKLKEVPKHKVGNEEGWIINPRKNYLAETIEKIKLPKGLGVDVDTRSSWARFGLRVQHVDDELENLNGYKGTIPLAINSNDANIFLREGDRICQAVVYELEKGCLSNGQIYDELQNGQLECYEMAPHDSKIKIPKFPIKNHSIQLTLNPVIKSFQEKFIDPKKDQSEKYVDINLGGGKEIPYMKFFLGSSNETLRIGDKYVGLLREIYTSPSRARVHSNAGYFDPGFEGTATLEQYIVPGGYNILYPGMKMGELEICSLKTPCKGLYHSKYSGQCGATPSKAHLDF